MNNNLRQEKKFLITVDRYVKYAHYFEQLLAQDIHNNGLGYLVRSLYFDTLQDRDYYEKLNGIEIRRKIRLRIYDTEGDVALLEVKQKQGAQQLKRSLKIAKEDAIRLTKGEYTCLLKYKEPFATECFATMNTLVYRPKSIVQYYRKAFVARENNTRLTFDHSILATENCFDLFSEKLSLYPILDSYHVILEVKYKDFLLSYIKEIINQCDQSEISISKYCLSRSIGLHYRL